jgi:hypothetical protein
MKIPSPLLFEKDSIILEEKKWNALYCTGVQSESFPIENEI